MNNKMKSILLACLMLVGVNAVNADITVTPGTYYFDFSKLEGGVVYGADVFKNINSTSYLVFDVTDDQPCNKGLRSTDGTNFEREDQTGFSKIVVGVTEGAALTQEDFLQVKLYDMQNTYTYIWIKYSTPDIGDGEFYGEVQADNTIIWKTLPTGFCESNHILTYSASSGGSVTAAAGGEAVSSGTSVASGTEVTLTAIPHQYYEFSHWVTADGVVGYETNHTITMPNHNYSVQAIFTTEDKDAALGADCKDCFYVTP